MTQDEAFEILKTGVNVYLTGQAGSGKTYVLNRYIAYLHEHNIPVAVTASTGIAATHIGGVTLHSWSGIGLKENLTAQELDAMQQKQYLWKRFEKTRVLIIDEISMLSAEVFDMVDAVCRAFKRSNRPFGGMQVVLSGDFFQLPPVVKGEGAPRFAYRSNAWNELNLRICYLLEQFRQTDEVLHSILNEMRRGVVSKVSVETLLSRRDAPLPESVRVTRLHTHNVNVDCINAGELEALPEDEVVFEMSSGGNRAAEVALRKSVPAPETLRLKKGAIVMFVKNNPEEGYVNGTLGEVVRFDTGDVPVVRTSSGKEISVLPARWEIVDEDGREVAHVTQVPLRLAWAITVHKSQGMSIDAAEIDLSKSFVRGQGYVALSRLREVSGLRLLGFNETALEMEREVVAFDEHIRELSKKTRERFLELSNARIANMHAAFVQENAETQKEEKKEKTHEVTGALLAEGLSVSEIARKRSLSEGTILSHFEKLKEGGRSFSAEEVGLREEIAREIAVVFKKLNEVKLSPVHKALKGKYSYDDIRKARLLL